jgi:hypothetical protein
MGIELIDRMNEVVVWQGIKNPEIYLKIAQALDAGEDAAGVAKAYGYRPRTVKKIAARMARLKLHRLTLVDGDQRIEIGTIAAGGGVHLRRDRCLSPFSRAVQGARTAFLGDR